MSSVQLKYSSKILLRQGGLIVVTCGDVRFQGILTEGNSWDHTECVVSLWKVRCWMMTSVVKSLGELVVAQTLWAIGVVCGGRVKSPRC
jgi:hypothetical protein